MAAQLQLVVDSERLNAVRTDYRHIEVKPWGGALGAEIFGVDLAQPLDDQTFAEIHQAFLDHLVIFFRDQDITPEQHKDFGRRFGSFHIHPFVPGTLPDHPEIMLVRKTAGDRLNFGGAWHSDVTFAEKPPLGTMLYAREVPEYGGDTLFANMYLAYEMLSEGMKQLLDGLYAVHTARNIYGDKGSYARDEYRTGMQGMGIKIDNEANRETEHPVVRTHPQTGRKLLFVNLSFVTRFRNMSERESEALLKFLCEHAVVEDFTCRFRWQPGSVAFWDNRCVQHYALNDYPGKTRVMHRLTINGDRPV
jgi:taurine dioxygenase